LSENEREGKGIKNVADNSNPHSFLENGKGDKVYIALWNKNGGENICRKGVVSCASMMEGCSRKDGRIGGFSLE